MNKREIQAIQTKNKIIDIAIRMILDSSFDNVTINQICTAAKVTKGAFYHHFNSKSDIVVEIYKSHIMDVTSLNKNDYEAETPIAKIHETVYKYLVSIHDNGIELVKQIFIHQVITDLKYYITEGIIIYDFLKSLVEDGQQIGEIRKDIDSATIAKFIIKSSRGLLYDWCINRGSYSFGETSNKDISLFLDSIRNTN